MQTIYAPKINLKPSKLIGISDQQIEQHWKLYEGYVTQTNKLLQELTQLDRSSLAHSDRRRRLGFELNGMLLHELYFENLKANIPLPATATLRTALTTTWGSFENWQNDFTATGMTRGIGWAMLCRDTTTNTLFNIFVADHENGIVATLQPLLVMDVWEHAYMVDQPATSRSNYIAAFINSINWHIVEERFAAIK